MKKFFAVYLLLFQIQESRNGNGVKALSPHLWIFVWILIHKMQILGMWWRLNARAETQSPLWCFSLWPGSSLFHLPEELISAGLNTLTAETRGLTPVFIHCSWCRGCSPQVPSLWSEVAWNLARFWVPCFRVGSAPAKDLKPRQSHMLTLFLTLGGIWTCNPWTGQSRNFFPSSHTLWSFNLEWLKCVCSDLSKL